MFSIKIRKAMIKEYNNNYKKFLERYSYDSFLTMKNRFQKFLDYLKIGGGGYLFVEHIELVVTTKCSLNCKDCSNMMPQYKQPDHININLIFQEIDAISRVIDYAFNCRILGGEPLLYPQLSEVINYALKKIKLETIHIVTNGTIVPKEKELINTLKNPRVIICISNYGSLSSHMDELIEFCIREKIRCNYSLDSEAVWLDFGSFEAINRSEEELKLQYSNCFLACKTYLKGQLHRCPRSAFATDLKYVSFLDDFVDMCSIQESRQTKRDRVAKLLYDREYLTICKYCKIGTKECKKIVAAVQSERE